MVHIGDGYERIEQVKAEELATLGAMLTAMGNLADGAGGR